MISSRLSPAIRISVLRESASAGANFASAWVFENTDENHSENAKPSPRAMAARGGYIVPILISLALWGCLCSPRPFRTRGPRPSGP